MGKSLVIMRFFTLLLTLLLAGENLYAQIVLDTTKSVTLEPILIRDVQISPDIERLEPVSGTYIYSGKKNEVIQLSRKSVSLTEKYARQLFAKIPGVFVYDMDGTGNQMNISTRGLDPHRGWEFNIRKDGIMTNSDMYGYPASHYNIPMEAVDRIELVRGTGSLQYGAQFGGMLNYITKLPDSTRSLAFESINTVGSYGLLSTYNGASGSTKDGKLRYSAWFNNKRINGYRDNSASNYDAQGISLYYRPRKGLDIKLDWTHSNYLIQLAGPLTDSMFTADPQSSTRSRNYYNPNIHVPSLSINWSLSPRTRLQVQTSAVLGVRNSILFDKPATVADTISSATLTYSHRQVDVDRYNSYTTEVRALHNYPLLGKKSTLSAGLQYMHNNMLRRQQGKGSTGTDYDTDLVLSGWGRDMRYKTSNMALFLENRLVLTERLSVNTGARVEWGQTDLTGSTTYLPDSALPNTIEHQFPLFGAGAQYEINRNMNVYAGWSQSYRPVLFKDLVPASIFEESDQNLEDAFGYNAEIGFRGSWKFLSWDISSFYLQYNNRMGTLARTDSLGNLTIYRTNIGDSRTTGCELFLQGSWVIANEWTLSVFSATAFLDARYQDAMLRNGDENVSIEGNKVESVPEWISRNGFNFGNDRVSLSALYSYTAESFADPFNTVEPNASGSVGLVPAYGLLDLHLRLLVAKGIQLQLNANNVLDEQYFTKRPQFYPGPGIWPSDGRTFSITASIRL